MAVAVERVVGAEGDAPAGGEPLAPGPPAGEGRKGCDRLSLILCALVLGAVLIGLVASATQRATMPFGDSHDGRIVGVWAERSRSLREQGPVASRLGTRTQC